MGCDEGFLITDRAFGGADVLATSYTISQGIRRTGSVDLIVCGKQTTDGDTAQVGAETAEHLGIPHLSNVTKILSVDKGWVTVEANQENMIVKESLRMPCLICMDSEINTPRLPSYRRKKALDGSLIHSLTLNDLEDKDSTHYGLKGSPTQVQKVFPPEKSTSRVMVEGSSEELAQKLNDLLADRKFI
jgi:electron transfer flavoprotein beta subunit